MATKNVEEEEFLDWPEFVLIGVMEKEPAQLVAMHEITIAALLRGAECAFFLRPEPAAANPAGYLDHSLVDAVPSWKLLDELIKRGYSRHF